MEETTLRQRRAVKIVKDLDAFPKIPDSYQEATVSGGSVSIVVFVVIAILVVAEFRYYSEKEISYSYEVDPDHGRKMRVNIDIIVAMPCGELGADILDATNENLAFTGNLDYTPDWFELSPSQQRHFETMKRSHVYLREKYHAMHELIVSAGFSASNYMSLFSDFKREVKPNRPHDACRINGTYVVNKVAGNFHITVGKSIPVLPRGHAHLAFMVSEKDYNFSHRIMHMSFGDQARGLIYPLDGDEKLTTEPRTIYQYFIQVVPTRISTSHADADTFQFAVNEQNRTLNHAKGSHGVAGIFFKYDLSSVKVSITESHKPYWQFLVRLCGIVGGIFATSGLLHYLTGCLFDFVCCRFSLGKYGHPRHDPRRPQTTNMVNFTSNGPLENAASSHGLLQHSPTQLSPPTVAFQPVESPNSPKLNQPQNSLPVTDSGTC